MTAYYEKDHIHKDIQSFVSKSYTMNEFHHEGHS